MDSWKEITLGEYIDVLTDYHANGSYESLKKHTTLKNTPDYALMVRTLNFERNDFVKDLIYLNEEEYNYLSKSKVFAGDVLMNKIANAGSVYIMPDLKRPVSLAMNLFLIRFKESVNQKFMYYLMKANEGYIKLYANGAATSTITKDAVRNLKFKIPPISIQNEIASVLSLYDDLIENNFKRIKLLEEIAQTTYEEWFVRLRFHNHEFTEIDATTGLPVGWVKEPLSNHVKLVRGIEPGSASYSEKPFEGCVPFLRVGDLNKRSSNIYVKKEIVIDKICAESDVLISFDGSPGIVSIGLSGAYSTGIRKAVIKSPDFANSHIYTYLKSSYVQQLIASHATGATILHAGSAVDCMEILRPTSEILSKFNILVTACFDEILNLKKQNNILSEAKEMLLPRLMNRLIDVETLMSDAA